MYYKLNIIKISQLGLPSPYFAMILCNKAAALCNNYYKYFEQWNIECPFQSTYYF
jgi:hypothetical protein